MNKFFEWLKNRKNWKWLIIGAFAVFIVPLLIIHLLFKIPYINEFFKPEWSAGELLGYIGAFYAFLGTAIFSGLALWQNHIIREKSDEYNQLLEKMDKLKNMPDLQFRYNGGMGDFMNSRILISNASENVARNISINNFRILDNTNSIVFESPTLYLEKNRLMGGENTEVDCKNPMLKGSNLEMFFDLSFDDKYFITHELTVKGIIPDARLGKLEFEINPR